MNLDILVARAKIVSEIRRFFDDQGFVEVETAVRIAAPAPEEHIDCPPVVGGGYLRASPELQMKKLLAAGMDKIYQIGPCFREGEKGSRHNPEFTMIEWYRRGATYLDIMEDFKRLFADLLKVQSLKFEVGGEKDFKLETLNFKLVSVRDAYREYAGWDPFVAFDQDRFDFDMATKIEPAIREMGGGVFLMDYPREAASLARISRSADGTFFAERWEFYCDGVELANCFTELCDGIEQRQRFERAKAARQALGEADYPLDAEFLDSIGLIGSAAGVALGVDRLVMMLSGERDIHSVRAGV